MTRIVVTGASGFVGRSVVKTLTERNYDVRATYFNSHPLPIPDSLRNLEWVRCNLCDEHCNYSELLKDAAAVIHLAARTHINNSSNHAPDIFRKENTLTTVRLATAAAKTGIKRFIYISTVKVHGEKTATGSNAHKQRFTENDSFNPADPYAKSKLEAEQAILSICRHSKMNYVILRPPLIYGPYVKANFLRLIKIIDKGMPLPFGCVNNQRSLLYVDNLSHAIVACIEQPEALNKVYLISDTDVSLPQLISMIAKHVGNKTILFPFPVFLLEMLGNISGKKPVIARLTDSLLVDNYKIMQELHWSPAVNFENGIKSTIDWYKHTSE
jgi:Nucleoside-diphosphate-sugar epimerases